MADDGRRWRGWWVKRYGRRIAFMFPPMITVRPFCTLTFGLHAPLLGVAWGRDEDNEVEVAVGVLFLRLDVTFNEWGAS